MPENSVAPFAFFYTGDLLNDYSNLELIATISTMETFQKIYRQKFITPTRRRDCASDRMITYIFTAKKMHHWDNGL